MEKKKKSKGEYFLIIFIVGFINFGLYLISQAIDTIYSLYEPHFLIFWGIIFILSFILGFFYITIWIVIENYFGKLSKEVD